LQEKQKQSFLVVLHKEGLDIHSVNKLKIDEKSATQNNFSNLWLLIMK